MSIAKKDLQKFISSVVDNWGSVGNKLSKQGAGHRLFPSRTPKKDAALRARLDQGEKLPKNGKEGEDEPSDKYNVNVQANNQGPASHAKLFTIQVSPNNTEEEVEAKLINEAKAKGLI
jgi:hypothetical protein